ncbi:MAG: PEP-CTERM sorting domain-containing protein [Cyanobacteria bacterium P01_A01_bin.45]
MTYRKPIIRTLNLIKHLSIAAISSVAVISATTQTSKAVVLTFDDIESVETYGRVPEEYGGLNWYNFGYVNKSFHPNSGYDLGAVSGNYTAFNWKADTAEVSGDVFNFDGVSLTSAWNNNLNVLVEGFANDVVKYSQTVVINPNVSSRFDFNYQEINRLVFKSNGGIDANPADEDSGKHFALDNFTFEFAKVGNPRSGNGSEVVPEPITIIGSLVAASFGAIFYRKSRQPKN